MISCDASPTNVLASSSDPLLGPVGPVIPLVGSGSLSTRLSSSSRLLVPAEEKKIQRQPSCTIPGSVTTSRAKLSKKRTSFFFNRVRAESALAVAVDIKGGESIDSPFGWTSTSSSSTTLGSPPAELSQSQPQGKETSESVNLSRGFFAQQEKGKGRGSALRKASVEVFRDVAGGGLTFCLMRMDVGAWSTGSLPFTASAGREKLSDGRRMK
jgi:hypothetical protein